LQEYLFFMKKLNPIYVFLLVILILPLTTKAVPASPFPSTRTLPDGSELTVYLKGDEFYSYMLSEDGYLIREDDRGYFNYVQRDQQGNQVPTAIRVRSLSQRTSEEQQLLATLQPYPDMQLTYARQRVARISQGNPDEPAKTFPGNGSPKSLVILVNFSDISFVVPNPQQAFTDLLNKENYSANGGTGSARDYFKVSSFGASSPEFIVVGPYTLPNNRAYYGGNDNSGNDQRPREMVMDACNLAFNAGVDFAAYDVDNDGIVDNVFIYYAGHNEAEHGPAESIWPHRWSLSTNLLLNGKRILGYACTSELRGSSGTDMCGIGTFAHEFGHVYGLPDYYPTNGATHHTVSRWNIMDAGAYLNGGRTPPSYSAYDRFFLNWLTPTLLKSPQDVKLEDLKLTNKAYIISHTDAHNMNGSNPIPVEFFTLEYRSKTGWDAFLPNSGMLITRVFYNRNDWQSNGPNNRADAMGFDIMEADGIASTSTLPGDVFPGTAKVTSYNPKLRGGNDIGKPITAIREENNAVNFRFMGGGNPPVIVSTQKDVELFSGVFGQDIPIQFFKVAAVNLTDSLIIRFNYNEHFELRVANDPTSTWSRRIKLNAPGGTVDTTLIQVRYNPRVPSHRELHYEYLIVSSNDADTQTTLLSGKSTRPIYVVPPIANQVDVTSLEGFQATWNKVNDATGYYLTVYSTAEGTSTLKEGFNNGLKLPSSWSISVESLITNIDYTGDSVPSVELKKTGDFIETETYPINVASFAFYVRSIGENTGFIKVEAFDGNNWSLIDNLSVTFALRTTKVYPISNPNHRKFRITYTKGTASVAVDDVAISFNKQLKFLHYDEWLTETSFTVKGIVPTSSYFYKVKASDRTLYPNNAVMYENITAFSNTVEVQLSGLTIVEFGRENAGFKVFSDYKGFVQLTITDAALKGSELTIYDTTGRKMDSILLNADVIALHHLQQGQLYVLKSINGALKILL